MENKPMTCSQHYFFSASGSKKAGEAQHPWKDESLDAFKKCPGAHKDALQPQSWRHVGPRDVMVSQGPVVVARQPHVQADAAAGAMPQCTQ